MNRAVLNPDGTTTRVAGRRNSRPPPASPRAEFQHRPRKSLEPITHREVGASMAHRGEAPARTSPDAAAYARRSAHDEEASMRLLLELQQRHRSMLQELVAQQALMPASVDPTHTPGLGATRLEARGAFPQSGDAHLSPLAAQQKTSRETSSPRRTTAPSATRDPGPGISTHAGTSEPYFAVFKSRNKSVPISEYDARTDGPLHVARELDVDPKGRTLVGVESGPHKELRVALDRLCSAPRYGALGMADELILLTADARVFRDDLVAAKSPDGALRFLILNESYQKAVAAHGSWVVDGDVVEDVLTDVVDEASKARSAPETERKELLASFAGGSDFNKAWAGRKRKRSAAQEKGSERRDSARETRVARNAEAVPLLDSRPAPDAPRGPDEKSAPARALPTPLITATTASSGSESSEGSETSTSGNSDSETASGGENDRASRSRRRREAVERAVAEAQRARLKKKGAASGSPSQTTTKKNGEVEDGKDGMDGNDGKDVVVVVDVAAAAAAVANDDSDSKSDSDVPFLDVEVVAPDGSAPHKLDAAASRLKRQPPRLEEFHAIRGLVLGSVANSLAAPRKKPPPASTVQIQLATPENQFHVLAVRCDTRSDEGDFGIRVGEGGLVYVDKKAGRTNGSTDSFEFITRFPEPVDEDSARSVVKDGVLFVVCEPEVQG